MPDLNTVPPSPHVLASAAARNQSSHQAATPSHASALNILPSNQNALSQQGIPMTLPLPSSGAMMQQSPPPPPPPTTTTTMTTTMQDSGVGPGPGPLRHPRPLTASELHMQLEKEQEAVVNRLTRELSLLRAAHNASAVSNTSTNSAATSTHDAVGDSSLLSGSGFSIPTSRRHHRTSSSASQTHQLASSYEANRGAAQQPARPAHQMSLSRQNSAASRRSLTESPAPPSSLDPISYFQSQRVPSSAMMSGVSVAATPGSSIIGDPLSPGLLPATLRYEETAFYRSELENAKKENEALKRRIRELERIVREGVAGEAPIWSRSDSVSTTASRPARHERQRSGRLEGVGIGVPNDEVRVGESAASGRLAQR